MTISTLVINIGIVAVILTLLLGFLFKKHKSWVMTFLQNFCGVLFIFSGWVKAVDPLGTAYKMEQYFAEFQSTFEGTWMSFVSPIFPFLSNYSTAFSVGMIVLEIVLGLALLLGHKGKLTSWIFLVLVLFFTVLTGFTFLTGYVPNDANFFEFSKWAAYNKNNMKVTDCGCFGDFIKLEPKISFYKDLFLLIPAFFFVFKHKDMHELFNSMSQKIILALTTVGLLIYCFSNYMWDIPHIDFRDFKIGTEVAQLKEAEEEALADVQVTHFVIKNKETSEVIQVPYADYMKNYKDYPKDKFETIDQLLTEPKVKKTKLTDFVVNTLDNGDVTDTYLYNEKYHFMLISHKLKYKGNSQEMEVVDTLIMVDTLFAADGTIDSLITKKSTTTSTKTVTDYEWPASLTEDFKTLKPFIESAIKDGHEVSYVIGGVGAPQVEDLKKDLGLDIDIYTADDILLKTIVRSNPGIVLWKNGKIVYKWHKSKLPAYESVKNEFLK